jgi:hypothetical protein
MPKKKPAKSKPAPKASVKPKKSAKAKPKKKAKPDVESTMTDVELERHREDKKKPAKAAEETMDRKALKVIVAQLKDAGEDIRVLKSDTDAALQKKVNEALQKLPTPEMLKKLESVSPEQLVSVLKKDCLGIFIDLGDVSCVRCKDVTACARDFIQSLKGGMKVVDKVLVDVEGDAKKKGDAVAVKNAKVKRAPVTRYEPGRLVFVRDVPNPNKGDDYEETVQAVLDEMPSDLAELREIVEREFTLDNDGDFMKFVTSMRDPDDGVIQLDVDLSEKDKEQLRKAGVEI